MTNPANAIKKPEPGCGQRNRWHIESREGRYWTVCRYDDDGSGMSRQWLKTRAEAEAMYSEMEANGRCGECGDVLHINYIENVRQEILERQICFTC